MTSITIALDMEDNRLSSVSQAKTLKEMGEFWDEHDFVDLDVGGSDVEFNISSTVSIEPDLLSSLEKQAQLRHVTAETLVNLWLYEKLAEQSHSAPAK